jgi:hypothetical protein|tara:strand:- start:496 stop:951 length:456 start_codon:yes stop_codon:yes gene_type:complete
MRIVIILCLIAFQLEINAKDLQSLRQTYLDSFKKEQVCDSVKIILENKKELSNIENAYLGVFHMMKCRFTLNPISKISLFSIGRDLLEQSIKNDPENLEIRFLRYSIQKNIPKILLYSQHISTDEKFIFDKIALSKDKELNDYITSTIKTF